MRPITEDLRRYLHLHQVNQSMELQVMAMKSAELCCAALGPRKDPMTRVDARLDWCAGHRAEYQHNRAVMRRVERALAAMEDPLERQLLRLRYTDSRCGRRLTWQEVGSLLYGQANVCPSTLFRHHRQALAHLSQTAADREGVAA